MREIKFRALTREGKVIRNVGSVEFFEGGDIIVNGDIPIEKLIEYTGLEDKNGTAIYEGDIVRHTYPAGYSTSEVKFGQYDNGGDYEDNDSGYGWYIKETAHYTLRGSEEENIEVRIHGMNGYPFDHHPQEVVGNIYENKELVSL